MSGTTEAEPSALTIAEETAREIVRALRERRFLPEGAALAFGPGPALREAFAQVFHVFVLEDLLVTNDNYAAALRDEITNVVLPPSERVGHDVPIDADTEELLIAYAYALTETSGRAWNQAASNRDKRRVKKAKAALDGLREVFGPSLRDAGTGKGFVRLDDLIERIDLGLEVKARDAELDANLKHEASRVAILLGRIFDARSKRSRRWTYKALAAGSVRWRREFDLARAEERWRKVMQRGSEKKMLDVAFAEWSDVAKHLRKM